MKFCWLAVYSDFNKPFPVFLFSGGVIQSIENYRSPNMSSKQSASKPDPRIAKREVMVTRHKSAQMKRQLRVKDRSMKHMTDLLKSPTKETHTSKSVQTKTKTSPKLKQSLLQSIEKVQKLPEKDFRLSKVLRKKASQVRDEEYYPNKKKRKFEVNRVVLKPTQDLKLVGSITGSVKRKIAVPHRASKNTLKASNPLYAGLSMSEVIRLVEDDMTDEDMMEILTCPSPVWWEDPPDEEYIEDAIFTRSPEQPEPEKKPAEDKMKVEVVDLVETESIAEKPIEITNLEAKSDNFLKKRSKLEGLLGNIKNKTYTKIRQTNNNVFNEDVVVICSGYRKHDTVYNFNECKSDNKEVKKQTLSESGDEISFHDSSMNVDEFLRDLENMDIPIEDERPSDVIIIEDDDDFLGTSNNDKQKNENKKRPKKETIKMKTNSDETLHMLKNVPVLKKYRLDKFSSPKSFDSSTSKTSGESSQDFDSISDTNIKFLLDDEVEEENKHAIDNEDIIKPKNDTNNTQTVEANKQEHANEIPCNKITEDISDNPKPQANNVDIINKIGDNKEVKMNDYYKTCKKVNQKKIKRVETDKTDINKNDLTEGSDLTGDVKIENDTFMLCDACKPQTKKVSDDKNVKYCLKCSCIFDSKDCTYCIEKSKSNVYKCVSCRIKFCCEAYFQVHALSHMEGLGT